MSETLRQALDRYNEDNGFREDSMTAESIQIRVLGVVVDAPNPAFQRPLLARHDLHHVLTGYGTDLRGEAEMGAWELGAGPGHWFVWLNDIGAIGLGVLAPIRTARAFARGLACRSLYRSERAWEELLEMDVGALREELGIRATPAESTAPVRARSARKRS